MFHKKCSDPQILLNSENKTNATKDLDNERLVFSETKNEGTLLE